MKELYHVKIYEVHSLILPVYAESEDDARNLAAKELKEHGIDEDFPDADYNYTLDRENWGCIKILDHYR